MRFLIFMLIGLITMSQCSAQWTPPEAPDPQEVLNSIHDDIAQGRYETAFDKQVWFHENALKLMPALSGVRLSFALSSWLQLGEAYPPALAKMKELRDALEKKIRDKDRVRVRFEDFHEFIAINRTLRQEERTAETFIWLEQDDPEDARRLFGIAQDALIKQREYDLVAKLIDPAKDIPRIVESYKHKLGMSEKFGKSIVDFGENKFVNEATTLVAILVHAGRTEEAIKAAEELKNVVDDSRFLSRVQREMKPALKGKVPTPFP